MVIKIKNKSEPEKQPVSPSYQPAIRIPIIIPPKPRTQNIIIRAVKIMLIDIRMVIHPKQTAEELEKYSQFADLGYGRK